MIKKPSRTRTRQGRHARVRTKVSGTTAKPRLCVFKSLRHIYAQVIDDSTHHTLATASTLDANLRNLEKQNSVEGARVVGELLAKKALEKGISEVVFDRNGYRYHGRIAALANAAREAGLKF